MSTTTKSMPEITTDSKIRISKRTGKPIRKYTKTGASDLVKQGISPRTKKPIRKYTKTGAAKMVREGISPRTGKPIRKYTKSCMTKDDNGKVVIDETIATASGGVVPDKESSTKSSVRKTAKKIVMEVVASDE